MQNTTVRTLVLCFVGIFVGCSSSGSDNETVNTTAIRDDGSTFDIGFLLNGGNEVLADSDWVCESWPKVGSAERQFYAFEVWRNGRGYSSAAGDFTWVLNGADVELTPDDGPFSIVADIAYDIANDAIGFIQFFSPSNITNNYCLR